MKLSGGGWSWMHGLVIPTKKPLKTQKSYVFKYNLYLYFLVLQIFLIFNEKMLMSAVLK